MPPTHHAVAMTTKILKPGMELLKEDMTRHEIKSLGTCNQMFINYVLGNPIVFCSNFLFFSLVCLVKFIGQPIASYDA